MFACSFISTLDRTSGLHGYIIKEVVHTIFQLLQFLSVGNNCFHTKCIKWPQLPKSMNSILSQRPSTAKHYSTGLKDDFNNQSLSLTALHTTNARLLLVVYFKCELWSKLLRPPVIQITQLYLLCTITLVTFTARLLHEGFKSERLNL